LTETDDMNYGDLTLHTDKYQVNMMYAHWKQGSLNRKAVFEVFFRKLPFNGGYAVYAGLERIVAYLRQLSFGDEEIRYLREQEERYEEAFLDELRTFRFTGNLDSVPEGTLVFAGEPIIRIEARAFEAHLIETALLNFMNYQTLVATKASRIRQVANGDVLLEFGTRRAQEADAAVWGARAAYIAGFHATSNLRAGILFGIPTKGTHAHAWIQLHDGEEEAFRKYAEVLPDQVSLLVDTYDTLRSGLPNAIKVGQWLESIGKRLMSIRLDSGDIAYLSKRARAMLDQAGLGYVKIIASNDLDENIILNLKQQGAKVDIWGVGTQLITSADQPSLGGVYKLAERENARGEWEPVIKISGNPEKVTNPGAKEVWRLVSRETGKAIADYVALRRETEPAEGKPVLLFEPAHPFLNRMVENYDAFRLLEPVFRDGELVSELPSIEEIRRHHERQLALFWPEHLRLLNPEPYRVNLSKTAWELKMSMLEQHRR